MPARQGGPLPGAVDDVQGEFVGGPGVRVAVAGWVPGEPGAAVLDRARDALRLADA